MTPEQKRTAFLDAIRKLVEYWDGTRTLLGGELPSREKLDGLAFSILAMIDGASGDHPPVALSVDGEVINDCELHELWYARSGSYTRARLDELKALKDGWLDGFGKAPCHKSLDRLSDLFWSHYPNHLPPPYVFPTPKGGVQLEWRIGKSSPEIKIDLDTMRGEWLGDDDDLVEIDLGGRAGWDDLASRIALLTDPKPGSIGDALRQIHKAGGDAWDKIGDPDRYIRDLRGE